MTLEEFYEGLGDLHRMQERIAENDKIQGFVLLLQQDDNFERLVEALDTGDAEDAFQSAHALKGICENLCLDNVTEVAVPVLEALRTGDISLAKQNFEPLEESYKEVLWRIDELD